MVYCRNIPKKIIVYVNRKRKKEDFLLCRKMSSDLVGSCLPIKCRPKKFFGGGVALWSCGGFWFVCVLSLMGGSLCCCGMGVCGVMYVCNSKGVVLYRFMLYILYYTVFLFFLCVHYCGMIFHL